MRLSMGSTLMEVHDEVHSSQLPKQRRTTRPAYEKHYFRNAIQAEEPDNYAGIAWESTAMELIQATASQPLGNLQMRSRTDDQDTTWGVNKNTMPRLQRNLQPSGCIQKRPLSHSVKRIVLQAAMVWSSQIKLQIEEEDIVLLTSTNSQSTTVKTISPRRQFHHRLCHWIYENGVRYQTQ